MKLLSMAEPKMVISHVEWNIVNWHRWCIALSVSYNVHVLSCRRFLCIASMLLCYHFSVLFAFT